MLKIIRRVLRLSGNLSKRIWGSFICGFLESMFGLLPIAAVFLVLIELQNGQPITGHPLSGLDQFLDVGRRDRSPRYGAGLQ